MPILHAGMSRRFVLILAVCFTSVILAFAALFFYSQRENSRVVRDVLLKNNASHLTQKAEWLVGRSGGTVQKDSVKFLKNLTASSTGEPVLALLLFERTSDDNFFRLIECFKLKNNAPVSLSRGDVVQQINEVNYLKKGFLQPTADPVIYSSASAAWQNVYLPLSIAKRKFVLCILFSADKLSEALEEYSETITLTKYLVLAVTAIALLTVFIAAYIYLQNFSFLVKGLTHTLTRVQKGDHDINLNTAADQELSELALSFNSLIEEMRDLREKEKTIPHPAEKDLLGDAFKQGVALLKEGDYINALHLFHTIIILKQESFGSYFNMGIAYAKLQDYDNSLLMFARAKALNPRYELTDSYIEKVNKLKENYADSIT